MFSNSIQTKACKKLNEWRGAATAFDFNFMSEVLYLCVSRGYCNHMVILARGELSFRRTRY